MIQAGFNAPQVAFHPVGFLKTVADPRVICTSTRRFWADGGDVTLLDMRQR